AQAVVEYKKANDVAVQGEKGGTNYYSRIDHKWGHTYLALNDPQVIVIPLKLSERMDMPTVAQRYRERCKELLKKKDKKVTADDYLELAEWALNHALLDDRSFEKEAKNKLEKDSFPLGFTQIMAQLEIFDPTNEIVQKYGQVRDAIGKNLKPDN